MATAIKENDRLGMRRSLTQANMLIISLNLPKKRATLRTSGMVKETAVINDEAQLRLPGCG